MGWPVSHEINEAVQNPATAFADADLRAGAVAAGPTGVPRPRSGNYADVYQILGPSGTSWAVKCFTRPTPADMRERYAAVAAHLKKASLPFTVGFDFLPDGVRVRGAWFPAVKMQWVDGFPLNGFVRDHLNRATVLENLLSLWVRLCRRLRETGMAHADLQHGNVLLVPADGGRNSLGLKLVDYDGLFVPALAGRPTGELGHAAYQHPLRAEGTAYSADLDRFPHLVVATALRALLVGGRDLWDRHDTGDNLLFTATDFRAPGKSKLMRELWDAGDPFTVGLLAHLVLACGRPLAQTPWLDALMPEGRPPVLTPSQERQAAAVLGVPVAAAVPAARPVPPPVPVPLPDPPPPVPARSNTPALLAALAAGVLVFGAIVGGVMYALREPTTETAREPDPVEPPKDDPPLPVAEPPKPAPPPAVVEVVRELLPAPRPAATSTLPALDLLTEVATLLPADLPDPPTAAAVDRTGQLVFVASRAEVRSFTLPTKGTGFTYVPDGQTPGRLWPTTLGTLVVEVRSADGKTELHTLDARTGRRLGSPLDVTPTDGRLVSLNVSPDGARAAAVSNRGEVSAFDLRAAKPVARKTIPGAVSAFTLPQPDLIAVDTDSDTPFVRLPAFEQIALNPHPAANARADAVSDDGTWLLYRVADGTRYRSRMRLNIDTMMDFHSPTVGPGTLSRMATAGGTFIAIDGNQVSVFALDSGRPLGRRVSPYGGPRTVAVAPGTGLFAVAWVNAVGVYRVGPDRPADRMLAAKPQVPAKPDADAAGAKVREAYKADLAKKSVPDRRKLAERLLKDADAAQPADRHAMLTLALATAADVPDPPLAVKAIDAMDDSFAIDAPAERLAAFEKMAAATSNTSGLRTIAEAAAEQADIAADADAYAVAAKLAAVARDAFAKSGQAAAAKDADARVAAFARLDVAFAPVRAALAKLAADPNDPAANTAAGRFRCFAQGRWDDGVVHLARCGDPALKTLGEMEAKAALDTDTTDLNRGDAWRDYAATLPEADRPPILARARHWWAKAFAAGRGVDKVTAENRLAFTANNVEFRPGLIAELSVLGRKRWGRVEPTVGVKAVDFKDDGPVVSVKWTGRLVAPVAGRYKLIAETPDAVRVTLGDDRPAIDGRGRAEAVVSLPDAPRTITITWSAPTTPLPRGSKAEPHGLALKWVRPGARAAEPVPPGALVWASSDKGKVTEK